MRASFAALIISMLSVLLMIGQVWADQESTEAQPDAELLEFLAIFDQQDTEYIDEMIDEQQDDKTLQSNNGEQYDK